MYVLVHFPLIFILFFVLFYSSKIKAANQSCSKENSCREDETNKYSKETNTKYLKYINKIEEAKSSYKPCSNKNCKCYSSVIKKDLKAFNDGISKEDIERVQSKGTKYQIINHNLYRDKNCMFPSRCQGIEYFLLKIAVKLPNMELIINTRDWPQILKNYGPKGPVFSFSKTNEYQDIMYPAWAFWEGGPAISLYPRGIELERQEREFFIFKANQTLISHLNACIAILTQRCYPEIDWNHTDVQMIDMDAASDTVVVEVHTAAAVPEAEVEWTPEPVAGPSRTNNEAEPARKKRKGRWDLLREKLGKLGNLTLWQNKISKAFFRGSRTSSERDPLVLLSRDRPDLVDAQYTKNQAWKSDADTLHAPPAKEVAFEDHCSFKYLFNFRGVAASFRFKHIVLCKSLVFHVGDEWKEFFYGSLKPWIHYIPVNAKATIDELRNLIEFAVENEDLVKEIAENGYEFIWNNLRMKDVECYWERLLKEFGKLLRFEVLKDDNLIEVKG